MYRLGVWGIPPYNLVVLDSASMYVYTIAGGVATNYSRGLPCTLWSEMSYVKGQNIQCTNTVNMSLKKISYAEYLIFFTSSPSTGSFPEAGGCV